MILEPAVTKQTVGIHFLLNRLLFVRHILRKLRARFSSETDFCSLAILTASQNEASIWVIVSTQSREKHTA